jgi:hypothetical protein
VRHVRDQAEKYGSTPHGAALWPQLRDRKALSKPRADRDQGDRAKDQQQRLVGRVTDCSLSSLGYTRADINTLLAA